MTIKVHLIKLTICCLAVFSLITVFSNSGYAHENSDLFNIAAGPTVLYSLHRDVSDFGIEYAAKFGWCTVYLSGLTTADIGYYCRENVLYGIFGFEFHISIFGFQMGYTFNKSFDYDAVYSGFSYAFLVHIFSPPEKFSLSAIIFIRHRHFRNRSDYLNVGATFLVGFNLD